MSLYVCSQKYNGINRFSRVCLFSITAFQWLLSRYGGAHGKKNRIIMKVRHNILIVHIQVEIVVFLRACHIWKKVFAYYGFTFV